MSVCILLAPSILLARPPGSPKHGDAQADRDRKREEPPCRLHAIVGQTTPAAMVQSSPMMKSYQNRRKVFTS